MICVACTREVRRETTKEVRRSAKEGRERSGASMGSRSVSSRARNSGEEKRAEELEKMPPADILVLSALLTNINLAHR